MMPFNAWFYTPEYKCCFAVILLGDNKKSVRQNYSNKGQDRHEFKSRWLSSAPPKVRSC